MGSRQVSQTGPEAPAHQAARHLLRSRLRSVSRLIADISAGRVKRPEYIHQLRVSIRRADAAINAFESCLGTSEVTRIRKRLRTIRKAAGAARDCDVHTAILPTLLVKDTPDHKHLATYLSRRLVADRKAAAECTLTSARPKRARKLKEARKALVASIARPEKSQTAAASTLLQSASDALSSTLAASRAAGQMDLRDLNHLHGLRVAAKQVRYAVELFRPCLPGEVCDSALARLREFQSLLGRVNDARQMAVWLTEEAILLSESRHPGGIPRGATSESIHEELRVLLGRFEAEREAAHAAALPEVAVLLDAALHPLEDWVRAAREALPAAGTQHKNSVGRDAQGPQDRAAQVKGKRRIAV